MMYLKYWLKDRILKYSIGQLNTGSVNTCLELEKLFDIAAYKNIYSLFKTTVRHYFSSLSEGKIGPYDELANA